MQDPFLILETLGEHRFRDTEEAGGVRTEFVVARLAVFGGRIRDVAVNARHDRLKTFVDFSGGPEEVLGVLAHLEAGDRDTTSVAGLPRNVKYACFL